MSIKDILRTHTKEIEVDPSGNLLTISTFSLISRLSLLMVHIFCCTMLLMGTSLTWAQGDCRLKVEDLAPIIQRYNPFFTNHTWDASGQIEMARMGEGRILMIAQDGCKRHHTTFTLFLDPSSMPNDLNSWVEEVKSLFFKIYWENADYQIFGAGFEEGFDEKVRMYGLNNQFNFPLATRNFICTIASQQGKGSQIRIEMVEFIFKEKVIKKKEGIPHEEDDGWKKN